MPPIKNPGSGYGSHLPITGGNSFAGGGWGPGIREVHLVAFARQLERRQGAEGQIATMKRSQVAIRWKAGLHLRAAARLVKLARTFRASVLLRANQKMADARSLLALLLLCATCGTVVDIEAAGEDEDQAITALVSALETSDPDTGDGDEPPAMNEMPPSGKTPSNG